MEDEKIMAETNGNRLEDNFPILKVGIIGLGKASLAMLPSFIAHRGFQIAAAADVRPEARDRFAADFQAEAFESTEEMCRRADIDCVYIATPHHFHAENTAAAAAHGKHIILEKPMALTLEECDRIIEAAQRHGVKLVVGHTHGFDGPVKKIRELAKSGRFGRLGMINTWNYTDFLYRPRRKEELDTALGGGILFNQIPHQVEIVRLIGGGMLRSVRAMTGIWDPARATEGSLSAFLEFADGTAATMVYSGYDHMDSDEFHGWYGESGVRKNSERYASARKALRGVSDIEEETRLKDAGGYGGAQQVRYDAQKERAHPHFGWLTASCEKADLRAAPFGVTVYADTEKYEVEVPLREAVPDKMNVLDELYESVIRNKPVVHDGRWGKATMEVCLALLQSGKERREIFLSQQVPVKD